jgi:hypothetical protein
LVARRAGATSFRRGNCSLLIAAGGAVAHAAAAAAAAASADAAAGGGGRALLLRVLPRLPCFQARFLVIRAR